MPSIVRGNTITLTGQFVDYGEATEPSNPLVDIISASGVTVVNNAAPTAVTGTPGLYEYEYDVAIDALPGTWSILWTGIVDGSPILASEEFEVLIGTASTGSDCDTPMWTAPDLFAIEHGITIDEAVEAIVEATWVLNALTNNLYHGIECRRDIYRNRPGTCVIDLEHFPVDEVHAVYQEVDGVETPADGWRYLAGQRVRICCTGPYGGSVPCHTCTDKHVIVDYRVKSNLPAGASRVTKRLAAEFHRSATGGKCALPERITSVTRQGVSWTILDPLDFLDKGLTGIGAVDGWIAAVNRRGSARLIDPLTRPPLVESYVTGCGEGCGE